MSANTTAKRCRKCDVDKSHSEFSRDATHKDGLKSYCKPCDYAAARSWARANRDRRSLLDASSRRKHWAAVDMRSARKRAPVIDLTPAYLEAIQTGACACCAFRPSDFRRLHLDRIDVAKPYQQGNVAYLCRTCNTRKGALVPDALLARFERDFARGVPTSAHDVLLALYVKRKQR